MHGDPVVRIEDLRVSLEGREVIRPLNLQIDYGERVCIVGAPGTGKSLLLELMLGRPVPHQGDLNYPAWVELNPDATLGVAPRFAVQLLSTNEQRRIASQYASFHQARWHTSFTAPTKVASFLSPRSTYGLREFEQRPTGLEFPEHEHDCADLVKKLGIEYLLSRQLSALSNGEWRKLLLARALLARPRLLLLDDPLGGIDADSRRRVLEVLTGYFQTERVFACTAPLRPSGTAVASEACQARGVATLVCTTPRPDELSALTTRTLVLGTAHTNVVRKTRSVIPQLHTKQNRAQTEPASAIVRLHDASVRSGSTTLLEHVSLEVSRGEHWMITGPNGAGKSTLLALLLGDHPQSYVVDLEVLGLRARPGVSLFERQRRIGYMAPELATHYPASWPVRDVVLSGLNASIGQFVAVTPADERVAEGWLERLDLLPASNRPLASLSEVEVRKVFLARALIRAPALLLLDEPTQGVTAAESAELLQVLDSVVERNNPTLLMVSHHAFERPRCITHHLALERGRVVACGRLGEH